MKSPAALGRTLDEFERLVDDLRRDYATVFELGHEGGRLGFGRHSRGDMGYSDPTGNVIADERKKGARDAARRADGLCTAALETLSRAQDSLADAISPPKDKAEQIAG